MEDHSKHIINKTEFPRGEWDNEPDKLNWIDEQTGLDCMIVRNHMGALCGYVAVDESHPMYGKGYSPTYDEDYKEVIEEAPDVNVHGGLTYASSCCGHICHIPEPGRPDNVWWFGFDCAHSGDLVPAMITFNKEFYARNPDLYSPSYERLNARDSYKNLAYVKAEVESLARQLKSYGSTN